MLLNSITYSEHEGTPQAWFLSGLTVGLRNLIVGKNATGKSRTLNVIGNLAKLIIGERTVLITGTYQVVFTDGGRALEYYLQMKDEKVLAERFSIGGEVLLERADNGEGQIFAEKVAGGTKIDFQTPQNEIAAFVRRDSKQHSFLEPLYQWGASLRHYYFGTPLGKDSFAVLIKKKGSTEPEEGKEPEKIIRLFERAKRDFPGLFINTLLADMKRVDYPLESVTIGPPVAARIDSNAPIPDPVGFIVQEQGLEGVTDQLSMSQGMFRVFALLVMVGYLQCRQRPACILIDDIGEGLDFERSCALIDLLREKAERSNLQIIASTNDRFVMNKVPLDEWSVLQRKGSRVRVLNHENSKLD